MNKLRSHNVEPQLLTLWVLNALFCCGVGYLLLDLKHSDGEHLGGLASDVHPIFTTQATVLALGLLVLAVVALHRLEVVTGIQRLLVNAAAILCRVDAARRGMFVRNLVVVGADLSGHGVVAALQSLRSGAFDVRGMVPADASGFDVSACAAVSPAALAGQKIWGIVVNADAHDAVATALKHGRNRGVRLYRDTEFWERHLRRVDVNHVGSDWLRADDRYSLLAGATHRLADICMSAALLLFTLPVMAAAAIAIKMSGPGPVLYRQVRTGLHGAPFMLLKFRSMRVDAEAGGPIWASERDPRITRVGVFLRRTRIDELPQLVNVLSGRMSMIGPRPERPHFVDKLAKVIPLYRERARVLPGLTGWAQVNFRYGASVEDAWMKHSYDLYYVKHRSPLLDIKILFATIGVILFQQGSR